MKKKISKKELEKKVKAGWTVDEVTPAKKKAAPPKKKPVEKKPAPKPADNSLAKAIEKSTAENKQMVKDMTDSVQKILNNQQPKVSTEPKVVEVPKPVLQGPAPKKTWKFTVERDRLGFIENITAEEL